VSNFIVREKFPELIGDASGQKSEIVRVQNGL